MKINANIVLELTVNNHAGVMSHIVGLFSRRGFNLEGILCSPIGDASKSKIYLLVKNDEKLDQISKQLKKLYDVLEVKTGKDYDHTLFERIHDLVLGA